MSVALLLLLLLCVGECCFVVVVIVCWGVLLCCGCGCYCVLGSVALLWLVLCVWGYGLNRVILVLDESYSQSKYMYRMYNVFSSPMISPITSLRMKLNKLKLLSLYIRNVPIHLHTYTM